ncbi:MAG: ectonucleotide pyrophosphatase/phosphodiesterase [Betaproteobacteria bacterium]
MNVLTRLLARLLAIVFIGLLAAHAQTPTADPAAQRTALDRPTPLILVSIDGFRSDYLQRGVTPVLSRLAKDGVTATRGMRPSFPSITFPNHYTLVTGLTPDRHGIVNNTMTDASIPDVLFSLGNRAALADRRWWDGATPIWVSAEQQGLRSATMFWPGSETDIQGVRPSDWRVYDANFAPDKRVDEVLAWIDRPVQTRPDLMTLYFDAVDGAGHRFGPDGAQTTAAVAMIDRALGRLIDGLNARGVLAHTNLLVLADHGMAALSRERVVLIDEMLDPATVERFAAYGPLVGFTPRPGKEAEVRKKLAVPIEHAQCWPKEAMPERFDYGHHARVPPFICLAEIEWSFATRESLLRNPPGGGAHGFDPADPQMAALFIATGPAFQPGVQLASFPNVDVYPLLARLLGIRPQPNQGRIETFAPVLAAPH